MEQVEKAAPEADEADKGKEPKKRTASDAKKKPPQERWPSFAVIIAVRRRHSHLGAPCGRAG